MICLAAAAVFASATATFAYEEPENKLGDRYPFLEQRYQVAGGNKLVSRSPMVRQAAILEQYANEVPENRIGDRYPSLEVAYRPASNKFAGNYLVARQAARVNQNVAQYAYEDPENRLGDRYAFFVQGYSAQRTSSGRITTAGRQLTTGSVR